MGDSRTVEELEARVATLEARARELADERRALSLALEEKASALARLQKSLESLSSRDGRTGLFNERYFHLRADQEIKRARRCGLPLSVVLCELSPRDDEPTPRSRGSLESLLGAIGRLLTAGGGAQARVRDTDVVARYGERGFGLLLPDTRRSGAEVVVRRVIEAVAEIRLTAPDERRPVTVAAGLAAFPEDASSRGELLERADQELYRARKELWDSLPGARS